MTRTNKIAGLEILRPYMKFNEHLVRNVNINTVNVIYEEVQEHEELQLLALGWTLIDDYWGFEETNTFRQKFNEWFDEQEEGELDYHPDMRQYMEDVAYEAMLCGVGIGVGDSVLRKAALEA